MHRDIASETLYRSLSQTQRINGMMEPLQSTASQRTYRASSAEVHSLSPLPIVAIHNRATAPFQNKPLSAIVDFSHVHERNELSAQASATGSLEAKFVEDMNGHEWRIKNPYYGNTHAALEVIMAGLFKMTGLGAPHLLLVNNCSHLFKPSPPQQKFLDTHKKDESCLAYVASRYVPDFKDLGVFVASSTAKQMIGEDGGPANSKKYHLFKGQLNKAEAKLKKLQKKYPDFYSTTDENILKKFRGQDLKLFKALEGLYGLLPQKQRDEQLKHYYVSLAFGNWDTDNNRLQNKGFRETLKEIKSMTVDFGSLGPISFKGCLKEDGTKIATDLRPGFLFKLPSPKLTPAGSRFHEKYATFNKNLAASITGISTQPFGRQSASIVKDSLRDETEHYETHYISASKDLLPALEVAYRFQLLPSEVIAGFIKDHWVIGSTDFPQNTPAEKNLSLEKHTEIILERIQTFIQHFPKSQILHWEESHPLDAAEVRQEIKSALHELGIQVEIPPLSKRRVEI